MAGSIGVLPENDCSYCPYFERMTNDRGKCAVTGREVWGHVASQDETDPYNCVEAFDRRSWCPLDAILEKAVLLPRDFYGTVIRNGTKVRLAHNGRICHVTNMTLANDNESWLLFSDNGGGGWLMPESRSNVEVLEDKKGEVLT